jgi:hypothetical protein
MSSILFHIAKKALRQHIIKYLILFAAGLATLQVSKAQGLPDSIIIIKNTYANMGWGDTIEHDSLYKTEKTLFRRSVGTYVSEQNTVDDDVVSDLIKELNDPQNLKNSLDRYNIDTNWIKNNPGKILAMSSEAKGFRWNGQQKELILKELVRIKYYEIKFARYLQDGCCYTMHSNYRYQYILEIYRENRLINIVTSRKYVWGFRYPWTDANNHELYSFKIEDILDVLLNSGRIKDPPLVGRTLLKYLANKIISQNTEKLHRLAPYTYEKEINELKPTFKIVAFTEMTGYGGYHGSGPFITVVLNNAGMLPNVRVQFLASKVGNTIYSRDSVIRNYKRLVDRIQSIKFIMSYLKANPQTNLDILYFNNKPVCQYNIDGVNKNPEGWKEHDQYVESLKWYEKNNYKPSIDIAEAIKVSEHNSCGCNYRFENEFINAAVNFIIEDENRNYSLWFLLPDITVLVHVMQGTKLLNYSYTDFGKYPGIQYPCVRFDLDGKIIPEK